jgi:hypothetical protein
VNIPEIVGWRSTGVDPSITKNVGAVALSSTNTASIGLIYPVGGVLFGPSGGPTVARFTAPMTGNYGVTASFVQSQDGTCFPFAKIFEEGSSVELLGQTDSSKTVNRVVSLNMGDSFDIIVDSESTTTSADNCIRSALVTASINFIPPGQAPVLRPLPDASEIVIEALRKIANSQAGGGGTGLFPAAAGTFDVVTKDQGFFSDAAHAALENPNFPLFPAAAGTFDVVTKDQGFFFGCRTRCFGKSKLSLVLNSLHDTYIP